MKRVIWILSIIFLMGCSGKDWRKEWKPSNVCIKGKEYSIRYDSNNGFQVEPTGYHCTECEYERGEYNESEDEVKKEEPTKETEEIEAEEPVKEVEVDTTEEPQNGDEPTVEVL